MRKVAVHLQGPAVIDDMSAVNSRSERKKRRRRSRHVHLGPAVQRLRYDTGFDQYTSINATLAYAITNTHQDDLIQQGRPLPH